MSVIKIITNETFVFYWSRTIRQFQSLGPHIRGKVEQKEIPKFRKSLPGTSRLDSDLKEYLGSSPLFLECNDSYT